MAEGFELYHVPQQTRRDKLRVTDPPPPNSACAGLLPSYEPSLHHDLLTCAGHGFPLLASSEPNIKGENANFMGFQPSNTQTPTDNTPSTALIDGSLSSLNPNDPPFVLELYRPDPVQSRQQGLSLSLSSNSHPPMEVNFQFPAPPGPFTGYTSILKGSIFMRPAQQLLQEICEFGGCCSGEKMEPDPCLLDPPTDESYSSLDDSGEGSTMPRLISMLDEVYRRYRQYCQHLQAVVASFESIPGFNNAAPFANFVLKSLSKHFKSLKTAITDQLQFMSKAPGSSVGRKHGQPDENDNFALYSQRPIHNSARIVDNQPVWRPQRGLPERAVSVLRSWLFEHFLHPYPTDTDKMMLAKQTGLSRNQVSNWFINARVRLWKPMVEEIHSLETRQQAHQTRAAASSSQSAAVFKAGSTSEAPNHARTNPSSSSNNPPEKRVRNELIDLPMAVHHQDSPQLNLQYGHQFGVGGSNYPQQTGGGGNGVSLTLALHQNSHHGMNGLLEPYPTLALAHRYELSGHDDGGFGTRARGVMGGHDFMG